MRKSLVKNICLTLGCLLGLGGLTGVALTSTKEATQVSAVEYSNSDYFINPDRSARTDYENVTSQNWMAFVSGDRTLNTINIPGTHDSSMKEIYTFSGPLRIDSKAKTQVLYIDEQLNAGIRYIDLRFNNFLKNDDGWRDLYYDLTLTHGKTSMGGTYYAESKNGGHLKLTEIIGYLRDFLTANPSETVIVSYQAETQESRYEPNIYDAANRLFKNFFREINPSTGKSFVYMEDGKWGKPITAFPKLADCRGQIVLSSDAPVDSSGYKPFPGGFSNAFLGARRQAPEGSYKDDAEEKKIHVGNFYQSHVAYVYDRVDETDDTYYAVGLNATAPDFLHIPSPPLDLAKDIIEFFFDLYTESPFLQENRRLGWVTMDGVTQRECEYIYRTNFCSSVRQNMRTLQVKSGLDSNLYPDQQYTVQLGAEINLPYNIYDYNQRANNNYFNGYSFNDEYKVYDDTVKIEDNSVIVCQWTPTPSSCVEVIWQDCDDENGFRPTSLQVEISPSGRVVEVTKEQGWFHSIGGEDISNAKPLWERVKISEEHPYGEDKTFEYRFTVEERELGGLAIRMIHTNSTEMFDWVKVVWEDGDNQLNLRPKEIGVTIFENGEEYLEDKVTADDDWALFIEKLGRAKDGIFFDHSLVVDPVDNYEAVIDGFTITMHVSLGLLRVQGSLIFIDNDDSMRPDYATAKLYHLDELLEEHMIYSPTNDSFYSWDFPVEAYYLLETYHTRIDDIENYIVIHTSPSIHHYAVLTSLINNSFVTTKIDEIGVVEFTTESKEKIDLARGLYDSLSEEEKALVTNYETLTDAESAYAGMDALYQQALPVIKEIENMPETGSMEWVMNIQSIKDHYDALSDEAKPYVYNYSKLENEYSLATAMDEVNLFGLVFLVREPDDPSDYEKSDTCAYTMERWDKLIVRYNALSDLAKDVVLAPDFEYRDAMMVDLDALYERYDLIIRKYGTEQYPDFLHRFSGPVIGTQNAMRAFEFNLDTNSTVLAICILAGTVLSFSLLVILKKKKI